MKMNKLGYAGIAAMLLLALSACGDKPTAAPEENSAAVVSGAEGNENGTNNATADGTNLAAESTPQPVSTTEPAATGNGGDSNNTAAPTQEPSVPGAQSQSIAVYYTDTQVMDLVEGKQTISFANDTEKYKEAFKALTTSDNKDTVPLWGKIELKSLKFDNGQIVMDIHKPQEAQLGAGGESFAMSALAKTLFQFKEVESIELLVDGEQVESLMGHVDLMHPMTRDNMQ